MKIINQYMQFTAIEAGLINFLVHVMSMKTCFSLALFIAYDLKLVSIPLLSVTNLSLNKLLY